MSNHIVDFISAAVQDKPAAAANAFRDEIEDRIDAKLADFQETIRQNMFGEKSDDVQAINELSPALMARYKEKAAKSKEKSEKGAKDAMKDADRADAEIGKAYASGRAAYGAYDRQDRALDREAKHSATAAKRGKGLERADFRTLSADEFKRKYRMTKAEWQSKNKS